MTPKLAGIIEDGKIKLDDVDRFKQQKSKLEGKRIHLILRKFKLNRTIKQNKYYWGVVVDILANHIGYEKQEMHEALKYKFLRREDPKTGLSKVKSSTELSTSGFNEYITTIQRWAASEYNLIIPDPNEVDLG